MTRGEKLPPMTLSPESEASSERIALDTDTMVVFDLDRTLIDTDRLVDITLLSLEDYISSSDEEGNQVDKKTAIAAIEKVRRLQKEETGNSFAYLEVLQREMGTTKIDWVSSLADIVIASNRDEQGEIKQSFISQVMLPNAIEILEQVDQSDADWLIMTAGQSITQRYKLALVERILTESRDTGIDSVSYFITDPHHQHSKAEMIDRSFVTVGNGDEQFFDPVLMSKHSTHASLASHLTHKFYGSVVLLDDKLANLVNDDGTNSDQIVPVHVQANNDPDRPGRSLVDVQNDFS